MKYLLNWRSRIFGLTAAVACLVILILYTQQKALHTYRSAILLNIKAQIRQDLNEAEYKAVNRSLKDLEDFGLIQCSELRVVSPQNISLADFTQNRECRLGTTIWDRSQTYFEVPNGDRLHLTTLIIAPPVYTIGFYSIIFSALSAFSLILLFVLYREKQRKKLEFISKSLAHDLRSPAGALSILISRLNTIDEESAVLAKAVATRINDIAEDVLKKYSSSAVATNQSVARSAENYSLRSLISQVSQEMKALSSKDFPKVRLHVNFEEEFTDLVQHPITSSDLGRILSNLIRNSFESIAGDGFITLEIRGYGDGYEIAIRDSGIGMSEEQLKNALAGVSHKAGGHGLGLSSSQRIVEECGGTFQVKSELGRGTQIFLSIPSK